MSNKYNNSSLCTCNNVSNNTLYPVYCVYVVAYKNEKPNNYD